MNPRTYHALNQLSAAFMMAGGFSGAGISAGMIIHDGLQKAHVDTISEAMQQQPPFLILKWTQPSSRTYTMGDLSKSHREWQLRRNGDTNPRASDQDIISGVNYDLNAQKYIHQIANTLIFAMFGGLAINGMRELRRRRLRPGMA